jgi:hypothetical protein
MADATSRTRGRHRGQQRGGGGGHEGAGASSPAPTRYVTGRKIERNRDGEKEQTGGPHM